MSKYADTVNDYVETISREARALLAATSDVAEEKVKGARKRLDAALDDSREIYGHVRKGALKGARYADETVRENPYIPIAIALVIGGLLALLFLRPRD